MRTLITPFFFFAVLLFCFSCKETEVPEPPGTPAITEAQQVKIDQLNTTVVPIVSGDPNLGHEELEVLDFLGDVRVVGLGEATHGTREFFQMKDRIFRYLVEVHGFQAFVFEMDVAEAMLFNDYIQGRVTPPLEVLMNDYMLFWTWNTQEVFDLLEWMKGYNDAVVDGQKLSFFGSDCQFTTYNADFLVNRLSAYDPDFADSINARLWNYRQISNGYYQGQAEPEDPIEAELSEAYNLIVEKEAEIIAALSERDYEEILLLATHLEQTRKTMWGNTFELGVNYRDLYMADNTTWVANFLGDASKIAVWAHNFHVSDFQQASSQGYYLKQHWTDNYKIVGFGFTNGAFRAVQPNVGLRDHNVAQDPPVASSNFLFHHVEADNFILKIDDLPLGSDIARFLTQEELFFQLGALFDGNVNNYYQATPLAYRYDVMIYFDETQAALELE
ncbi:MAG: erythromycin esterase family protein [Bacteroidota bacterium]